MDDKSGKKPSVICQEFHVAQVVFTEAGLEAMKFHVKMLRGLAAAYKTTIGPDNLTSATASEAADNLELLYSGAERVVFDVTD